MGENAHWRLHIISSSPSPIVVTYRTTSRILFWTFCLSLELFICKRWLRNKWLNVTHVTKLIERSLVCARIDWTNIFLSTHFPTFVVIWKIYITLSQLLFLLQIQKLHSDGDVHLQGFFSCSANTHDKCKTSGSNNLITIKEKANK